MQIALLEDDKYQADAMQVWLEAAGHGCQSFRSGQAFLEAVNKGHFDLFILDWVLPDMNGIEVLQTLRATGGRRVPVLFVTQMDKEEDVILALETGADDYMSKPVKPLVMLARITALGRRAYPELDREEQIEIGDYRLNTQSRSVECAGELIDLTHKEFDLTLFLFRNIGHLLSRGQILEAVWATTADLNTRTVDTHISRIRNKLRLQPENGWKLSAIYQHGYRLERLEQPTEQIGESGAANRT